MAKVLIFIVAYNAEKTIESVLKRIPPRVLAMDYKILVIDDKSKDKTFEVAEKFRQLNQQYNLTVLFNPVNQGYGGNQKIGYQYAIENGYDAVVLLHGDGQYAPEILYEMLEPIIDGKADAVFGSRMMKSGGALKGGMPLYKYVGNKILTTFQNRVLKSNLTEFHSGYRAYSVKALAGIPFQYNTNNFHFDTEIIIQFMMKKLKILEIPIPTYYGDEICHVNGLAYAWNVFRVTLGSKLHEMELFYRRNYDVHPPEERYKLKLGYVSSHTMSIDEIKPESRVLDVGCGKGLWAAELKKQKRCIVEGIDEIDAMECHRELHRYTRCDLNRAQLNVAPDDYDYIALLDVIEHLDTPVQVEMLNVIRNGANRKKPVLIISTPNIGFIFTRISLLLGQFNYGRRGILDRTHRHLFTLSALRNLLTQSGYKVEKIRAIPPPYPEAIGDNWLSRLMLWCHNLGCKIWPRLFGYQFMVVAQPLPTVHQLLELAVEKSSERAKLPEPQEATSL